MCVAWIGHEIERGPSQSPLTKEQKMAQPSCTPRLAYTEEVLTVHFCLPFTPAQTVDKSDH